jgi:hypothetical protein
MSGQVSGLVLRMAGPAGGSGSLRTPLRASPEPLHEYPDKSAQIRCRSPHIRANNRHQMLREPGLGPSRASHQSTPSGRVAGAGGRVAAGLLPFPATACLETSGALISSLTKKVFVAPSLSAGRSYG